MISLDDTQQTTILRLQSLFRAKRAQRLYRIPQLPADQITEYQIRIMGNDPNFEGLSQHKVTNEKIAIIGTSGLKVLDIAYQLSDLTITPKIIIVDNSKSVIRFWRALREFVCRYNGSPSDFDEQLVGFIESIAEPQLFNNKAPIKEPLLNLLQQIGQSHFISMVKHSSILLQDWGNKDTFIKLKNILKVHGIDKIYLYPSNIACFTKEQTKRELVLSNIEQFNPTLSLQTNYSIKQKNPTQSFIFSTRSKEFVENRLIPPGTLFYTSGGRISTKGALSTSSSTNSNNNEPQ